MKSNRSGYHKALESYADIRPSMLVCPICGEAVLRGSGKRNKADATLSAAIYACRCIYRSSSQLNAPPLQADWDREVTGSVTQTKVGNLAGIPIEIVRPIQTEPSAASDPQASEAPPRPPGPVGGHQPGDNITGQGYTIHPVALKFPEISPEEYAELKESIRKYGQFDPIIVSQGKVLDGRHRYQICLELGIKPKTINFSEHQAKAKENLTVEEFIFDSNVKRRHLTPSQRAAIAAEFANMRQGERTDMAPCDNNHKVSQEKAAEMLDVSRKSVSRAKQVKDKDPKTFAKVKAGDVSLNEAIKSIDEKVSSPPIPQNEVTFPTVSNINEEKDPVQSETQANKKDQSNTASPRAATVKPKNIKLQIEAQGLWISFLEPLSTPLKRAVAQNALEWSKEFLDQSDQQPKRRSSVTDRWSEASRTAREAIEELIEMQAEFQSKFDELSERQHESEKGERLSAICELDLESAQSTIEEAHEIELP